MIFLRNSECEVFPDLCHLGFMVVRLRLSTSESDIWRRGVRAVDQCKQYNHRCFPWRQAGWIHEMTDKWAHHGSVYTRVSDA